MSDEQILKERTDSNFFVQLIQRYLPFWPLFVITIVLSLTLSYIYLRSQIPIYVANAKILLKDPEKGGGADNKLLDALNIFGEKKIVENEIVVLRSTDLMEQVVKQLNLYANVYNKGRVQTEELYKENSPAYFVAQNPDSTISWGKYYFKIDWNRNQIHIDNKTVIANSTVTLNNTIYRVQLNPYYNKHVTGKNFYVQFSPIENAAKGIIGGLKASPVSVSSTVIDLKLETPVPQKGIDVLAKLFEVYNKAAINDKNLTAAQTMSFIDDRLKLVSADLNNVERDAASYKSRNGMVDLSAQAKLYLENVKGFDQQNSQVDIQLSALNEINKSIQSKQISGTAAPSLLLLNEPVLSTLVDKLYESQSRLDRLKSISGEKNDQVLSATQEVTNLKQNINENLTSIKNNLLSVKRQVTSGLNQNSGLIKQIPQKEQGYVEISRQQGIKNAIYSYLLQRREETAITSASTIADLRIIETANSYGPIKPIANNYYLSGLLLGILSAVAFVLIREQFNRKVLFRNEIEQKTKVPVVGEIIQIPSKDPIVIYDGKRTVIAEQFRSLRTNLSFMGVNDQSKTILITSSISGEGKSFVAINLAISFTLTGKKVALMEMDLRKPKLSKLLKLSRDPGISSYLIGKSPVDDIIKQTSVNNLFLVSSGPIPPNPTELISSQRFKDLMIELQSKFDHIIIDTAPVGPVTDAQLLKNYSQSTIYVIRHDVTPKNYLRMIEDLSQAKKFNGLSIVFNGIKKRGFSYSSYGGYGGYGQGYGYGYGYGGAGYGYYVQEEKKEKVPLLKNIFKK